MKNRLGKIEEKPPPHPFVCLRVNKYQIDFKILLLTFKSLHQQGPVYLRELLKVKDCGSYNLRSNNSLLLTLPPAKSYTTLGDRAFMYAAPKLWNALPEQIALALKFLRLK